MNKTIRHGLLQAAIAAATTFAVAGTALADPPTGRGNARGGGEAAEERGGGRGSEASELGRGIAEERREAGRGNGNGDRDGEADGDGAGRGNGNAHRGRGLGRLAPRNPTGICGADVEIAGPDGQSGRSHVAHVTFGSLEEDGGDEETTGPWARMMYFWIGSEFSFVLNAHELEPGSSWTLVADVAGDADGTTEAVCLGEGTANPGGQLHVLGRFDPESHLPPGYDPFTADDDDTDDANEVAVRLVPGDAVDCETGAVSDDLGDTILESDDGIRFVDTDELECPSDDGDG